MTIDSDFNFSLSLFLRRCHEMDSTSNVERDSIVPDVIDIVPVKVIQVKYPSGTEVHLGNELTPTQVKDEPQINWEHDESALYTLIMTDPDGPSRSEPTFRECLHWLVVNIPSNKISDGKTMVEYIGSGPPKGTGLHRYIFLIFKQNSRIEPTEPFVSKTAFEGRLNFKTRDFSKKYDLGQPLSINYFQAAYDDYCPILQKQLGWK